MEASEISIRKAMQPLELETPLEAARQFVSDLFDKLKADGRESAAFGEAGLPLQEAFAGVEFGILAGFTHITLAPQAQQGFDVTLRRGDEIRHFDVTEAADRLRGREFEVTGDWTWSGESDQEMSYQENLFSRAVGRRLRAKQDPTKEVVIYVNTGWLPDEDEVANLLRRWHDYFKDKFRSAHILIGMDGQDGLVQIAPEYIEVARWRPLPRDRSHFSAFDELFPEGRK